MSMLGLHEVLVVRHSSMPQVKLTDTKIDMLVAKMKDMVGKADAKYEVTLAMLKRSARCKASSTKLFAHAHVASLMLV